VPTLRPPEGTMCGLSGVEALVLDRFPKNIKRTAPDAGAMNGA